MNLYKWTPCFLCHPKDSHWWNQASQLGLNGCHFDIQLQLMKKATKERSTIPFHRWKLGSVENSSEKQSLEVAGPIHLVSCYFWVLGLFVPTFHTWQGWCPQRVHTQWLWEEKRRHFNIHEKRWPWTGTQLAVVKHLRFPWKPGGKAIFPGEWILIRLQT